MLRLATSMDIPEINRILNHPDVYRWATMGKDMGPMDITPAFDQVHVLLEDSGGGCIVLDPYSEDTFEVHTCLLDGFHGKIAEEIARDTVRFVFAETGGMEILTNIQTENKAADLFARQCSGFIRIADAPDLRSYQLRIERWPYLDAGLESFCPAELEPIVLDAHHRRLFGALMLTSRRGFMGKAVAVYNKHARLQGYLPVEVCGLDSLTVGGLTIHFLGNDAYQVGELCQSQSESQAS